MMSSITRDKLRSLELLDQIIEFEKLIDQEQKKMAMQKHKSSQTVGESWAVHHLKILRELIILEHAESGDNRPEHEKK
jgi:hypothetical protein